MTGATTAEPAEGRFAKLKRRFDHYQRRTPWLGFPIGVFRKFSQDKAGYLAALVSYFGFFSVFPLMLAFISVLGFIVPDAEQQREFADAAADELPVVGTTVRQTAGEIDGSVLVIVLGVLVALWAGLRIVDAMQNAMNEVWNLPHVERPKLLERRARGLLMLGLLGVMLVVTVAVSNVAVYVDVIPGMGKLTIMVLSIAVSIVLYLLSFQLLTDKRLPWKDLLPGAIFGGVCWWGLQTFGTVFIARQQENASATYGQFAAIIALMAFLFLAAQLSILGAEIGVVKSRKLWPRSLTDGDLTDADLAAFEYLARSTQQDDSYEISVRPASDDDVG